MKCQYCGVNLGLEHEVCPFCGRENQKAEKYIVTRKHFQNELDETKQKTKKLVKINARTGRLLFVVLMVFVVVVMTVLSRQASDVASRIDRREQQLAKTVEKNIDSISTSLAEMEQNREYLLMSYYELNYNLSSHKTFADYSRVFNAVICYRVVFDDILNISTGYDRRGEMDIAGWCKEIASNIVCWDAYVEGTYWNDAPDSPMHAGEHGAFIQDCKEALRDMVKAYFGLTEKQLDAMWSMEEASLGALLYERYCSIYPEEDADA